MNLGIYLDSKERGGEAGEEGCANGNVHIHSSLATADVKQILSKTEASSKLYCDSERWREQQQKL